MVELNMISAFVGGVVSFFSPCVVPLIPVYMGYLADTTMGAEQKKGYKKKLFINALGFLLGLMIIFSLLGLTATSIGLLLLTQLELFRKMSGVVIILFGLFHSGLIKFNFLNRDRKMRFKRKGTTFFNSILLGMAFSFGWTPCVGPVFSAILVMAANSASLVVGIWMLVVYSIGFSTPFLAVVFFMEPILKALDKNPKIVQGIKIFTSIFIVLMGVFVYLDYFSRLSSWIKF